jgi:tetratricopeptide (TPR) repeat protein
MSLLMQALKKAERTKQNSLQDEETLNKPSEAYDELLALTQQDVAASPAEFTLAPMDGAPPEDNGLTRIPVPTPAEEAPHDPTPPQSRLEHGPEQMHEPEREPAREQATVAASAPEARTGNERRSATGTRAGRAGAAASTAARARATAVTEDKIGMDPARIRLAALCGILALILALFGYLYWRAINAPGPGARLPMVPMPPLNANGARPVVVVAPAGGAVAADSDSNGRAAIDTPPGDSPRAIAAVPASPRSAPASTPATIMATPEEIERAMQIQAAQQGNPGGQSPMNSPGPGQGAASGRSPAIPASPGSRNADSAWSSDDIKVSHNSNAPRISPALQSGYQAYTSGDLAAAAQFYSSALQQEPNSRDALLGSAAVSARRNDARHAAASYLRLLELNPNDPDALAGLLNLRPGDTGQSELRLKDLLRKSPDSGPLLFALGNLYARQNRWSEAQQGFFRAYTASPDNPDYAFNLAVGLDRLNQPRLALTYYQRALALAQAGAAAFDREAARLRVQQLTAIQ